MGENKSEKVECIHIKKNEMKQKLQEEKLQRYIFEAYESCLSYTSDAADERYSGDLGGRRIIKEETNKEESGGQSKLVETVKKSSNA